MSSDAPVAVQAKPGCPDKHRAIVERSMAAMPPAWRLAPQTGEVFDSLQLFEDRVRAWSFCDGFEVVRVAEGVRSGLDCAYSASTTARRLRIRGSLRIIW